MGLFAVVASSGCRAAEPAQSASPEAAPGTGSPSQTQKGPLTPAHGRRSADCVDPPTFSEVAIENWNREVAEQIDEFLPELAECAPSKTSGGDENVMLALKFDELGAVKPLVVGSTLKNCAAARCLKKRFASFRASPPPEIGQRYVFTLDLARKTPPKRLTEALSREAPPGACADPGAKEGSRLAPELIEKAISDNYGSVHSCYEAGLARNSRLKGSLELLFKVEKEGHVSAARAAATDLRDCAVVRCIVEAVKDLSFPPPEGNASLSATYRLRLRPEP